MSLQLSLILGVLLCAAGRWAAARPSPGPESLRLGFLIASRIEQTADDRDKAQWQVAMEYVQRGEVDLAWQAADLMRGWRRGLVYAELAPLLYARGRPERAQEALAKAKAISLLAEEWRGPRVAAYVAAAHARIGALEQSAGLVRDLPLEERGRAGARLAAALAERGELAGVLADLRQKEGLGVYEVNEGLVMSYLALARQPRVARDLARRREVLVAARRVAAVMPPLFRLETDLQVAELLHGMGLRAEARATLTPLDELFRQPEMDPYWRAPALAQLAGGWHRLGETETARALLAEAHSLAPQVQAIDRPKALAAIAAGYDAMRDPRRARQTYREALTVAAGLTNARTRALAAVEVCVSMSRRNWPVSADEREQLTALWNGLGAPW